VTIPWDSLRLQLGCSYKDLRHPERRLLKYLKSVISYYPELRLRNIESGLQLQPSPTHATPPSSPTKE
jgi:hypothetical protein